MRRRTLGSDALRGRVGRKRNTLSNRSMLGTPLYEAVREILTAPPREASAYLGRREYHESRSAGARELSRTDHNELSAVWRGSSIASLI